MRTNKYLNALIEVLTAGPVIIVCKDPAILVEMQRAAIAQDVRIKAKRKPMQYRTQAGYIWEHQNTREYEISI